MSDISFENSLKLYFNGSLIVTAFLITALIDSFSNSRISIELYGLITNLIYLATSYVLVKIINHKVEGNFLKKFFCIKDKADENCYYKSLLHWTASISLYYPLMMLLKKFGVHENFVVYGWGSIIALLQLNFVRKAYRIYTSRNSPIFNIITVLGLCAITYFLTKTDMSLLNIAFIVKDLLCASIIAKIFYYRDKVKKVLSLPVTYVFYATLFGIASDMIIEHVEMVKQIPNISLYIFNGQFDLLLLAQALMLFFAVFGKYIGNGSNNELIK